MRHQTPPPIPTFEEAVVLEPQSGFWAFVADIPRVWKVIVILATAVGAVFGVGWSAHATSSNYTPKQEYVEHVKACAATDKRQDEDIAILKAQFTNIEKNTGEMRADMRRLTEHFLGDDKQDE